MNISAWIKIAFEKSFIGKFINEHKRYNTYKKAAWSISIPFDMVTKGEWYYVSATFKPNTNSNDCLINSIKIIRKDSQCS